MLSSHCPYSKFKYRKKRYKKEKERRFNHSYEAGPIDIPEDKRNIMHELMVHYPRNHFWAESDRRDCRRWNIFLVLSVLIDSEKKECQVGKGVKGSPTPRTNDNNGKVSTKKKKGEKSCVIFACHVEILRGKYPSWCYCSIVTYNSNLFNLLLIKHC